MAIVPHMALVRVNARGLARRCFSASTRNELQSTLCYQQARPPIVNEYAKDTASSKPAMPQLQQSSNAKSTIKSAEQDLRRGYEASLRAAQTGKTDPKYRAASRRVISIMVGIPFVLVLGWELFQRQFMGKEVRSLR